MAKNTPSDNKDRIYSSKQEEVKDFSFNDQVADVFQDMIARSVPGYKNIIDGIGKLSAIFAQDNTHIYDLGCSLGAASLSMAKQNNKTGLEIIGVDNSAAMVSRCQRNVNNYNYGSPIHIIKDDIACIDFKPASVIVMNFTLQFIDKTKRDALMMKIHEALVPGGILILSEKIKLGHPKIDSAIIDCHHEFKRENGYSDLEIAQKRTALENVMILDEFTEHEKRLKAAGFSAVSIWYQQFNFASFCAIKGD
jgi:tRNA (cmo5U34)-methyltransferase